MVGFCLHACGDEFDEDAVDDEAEGALAEPDRGVAVGCVRVAQALRGHVGICRNGVSRRARTDDLPLVGHGFSPTDKIVFQLFTGVGEIFQVWCTGRETGSCFGEECECS